MNARTLVLAATGCHGSPPRDRWPEPDRRRFSGAVNGGPSRGRARAFTLIEMLVVIGIIAALAVSAVPAIRSLSQSNTLASGSRQILDELALARQMALSERRTVYVVLVPPSMREHHQTIEQQVTDSTRRQQMLRQFTNLVSGQYTAYALFTKRTVGDQPGRQTPRYLNGGWKRLPDGMFFATNRFGDLGRAWTNVANLQLNATSRVLPYGWFPFPAADSPELRLPYVAFDPSGRLVYDEQLKSTPPDAALALTRGSIFYAKDNAGKYLLGSEPDVVATPRTNRIDVLVNRLTGRAHVLEQTLP